MHILDYGYRLLWVAIAATAWTALLCLLGVARRDRRFIVGARMGFLGIFVVLLGASLALVQGFLDGEYNNLYIFDHSEERLPLGFKLAGLWAGLEGSLLFWTCVLAGMCSIAAIQHRWSARHPAGRRMEPYTYLALTGVLGFFLFLCVRENPFETISARHALAFAQHHDIPLDEHGRLLDGKGLNPQLCNYWFVIHPPCLYLGLITFTIPFAFGLSALISGELGSYWVRIARRWAMVGWMFLTSGIILGGLWAYRQLGWGGYWAWDPVENASFLPWCTATAFLHSIMIQERRDMLKWWNAFLIFFTFFLTIEATYMTRSGEISGSVHTFAENASLGDIFRYFKFVIAGVGLFLLFFRYRELRGTHRLESLLSREAAFFVNNLVLIGMGLAVWFLSWAPTNSHSYLGQKWDVDLLHYNRVMTPLFAALLFLTAVGPGLGWVRSTPRSLVKNFLVPVLGSAAAVGVVYAGLAFAGEIRSISHVLIPKAFHPEGPDTDDLFFAEGLYPTGILLFSSFFIMATVVSEFVRAVRGRMRVRKDDLIGAAISVFTRDNRRYGGYTVHIGLALMAIGIVSSSMFRTYRDVKGVEIGDTVEIGPYYFTVTDSNRTADEYRGDLTDLFEGRRTLNEIQPGLAYFHDQITIRVSRVEESADADGEKEDLAVLADRAPVVTELHPERRYFPKQENWIPEVSIDRGFLGDIYGTYRHRDGNTVFIEVFLNPLMILIWLGWFVMIAGGLYAMLPMGAQRVGLSE